MHDHRRTGGVLMLLVSLLGWGAAPVLAEETTGTDAGVLDPAAAANPFRKVDAFSPYAAWNYPMRVFWGDQHVHTGWSADAGAFGCTLGPEQALRFARGEARGRELGVGDIRQIDANIHDRTGDGSLREQHLQVLRGVSARGGTAGGTRPRAADPAERGRGRRGRAGGAQRVTGWSVWKSGS